MNAIPKIKRWSDRVDPDAPAARVIDKFGGLSKFCQASGINTSTVHDWLVKGLIPQVRWPAIMGLARELDIELSQTDFLDQRVG